MSVFLYDIQEDLGMRTGESRQYAPGTKALGPYSKQYFPDPQRRGG